MSDFASFGGLLSPPKVPVLTPDVPLEDYLSQIESHLKKVNGTISELGIAVESSHAVDQSRIINLTADNIFANNIITEDLTVGSDGNITLSGLQDRIDIFDNQAVPELRVRIGKLGATATEWGIQVMDSAGAVKFQSSTATFIDGAIITNATIVDAKIVDVDGNKLQNGTVTDAKINDISYSKITSVAVTNSDIVSVAYSKITSVAVTNADIVSVAWSKITSVNITDTDIQALTITGGSIANLTIVDGKIGNTTISTGKHQANAITDSTVVNAGNVTWTGGITDHPEKTLTSQSVATGGVDVIVLYGADYNDSGTSAMVTFTVRYKRSGSTQKTIVYPTSRDHNISVVFTDTGTTGTHTLSITGDPSNGSNGTQTVSNQHATFILLKT